MRAARLCKGRRGGFAAVCAGGREPCELRMPGGGRASPTVHPPCTPRHPLLFKPSIFQTRELCGFQDRVGGRLATPRLLRLKPEDVLVTGRKPLRGAKFTWVRAEARRRPGADGPGCVGSRARCRQRLFGASAAAASRAAPIGTMHLAPNTEQGPWSRSRPSPCSPPPPPGDGAGPAGALGGGELRAVQRGVELQKVRGETHVARGVGGACGGCGGLHFAARAARPSPIALITGQQPPHPPPPTPARARACAPWLQGEARGGHVHQLWRAAHVHGLPHDQEGRGGAAPRWTLLGRSSWPVWACVAACGGQAGALTAAAPAVGAGEQHQRRRARAHTAAPPSLAPPPPRFAGGGRQLCAREVHAPPRPRRRRPRRAGGGDAPQGVQPRRRRRRVGGGWRLERAARGRAPARVPCAASGAAAAAAAVSRRL